jgi:purine-binding chemotaxis protein CheW
VRGVVIPVIDMPTRLGLRKLPATRDNRVLIVEQGGERYGLAVDAVEGVVTVVPEELEDAPGAIFGAKGEFILALARHNARLYIILDLAMLLKGEHFLAPHIRGGGARGW